MLCSELMKRDVECCLDTSLIPEAARAMRDRNVGFLPVWDDAKSALGTLTDRDIVVRVLGEGRAPDRTRVREVMTLEVVSCRPDDDLSVAEELMIRFKKSRMICADPERHIVGVISLSDIAKVEPRGHAARVAASIAIREAISVPAHLRASTRELTCRDVMKTDVECSPRKERVDAVAALMRSRNIGFVPVCDVDGGIIGTLTDRDLVLRVVAEGRPPETTRAEDVLTPELVFCSPDDPLKVAEDLMAEYKKSRMVCADPARRPLGVISLSDLARVERSRTVSRVLREISSRGAHPSP